MNKTIAKMAHGAFSGQGMVIAFDTETTGLNEKTERIVELAYKVWDNGELVSEKTQRFLPWDYEKDQRIPISKEAAAVNGIKESELDDMPKFKDLAGELRQIFTDDATYVGYNVEFDLKMIREEFKRCGEKDLQYKNCRIIDPLKIWKNTVPKNRLVDAYKTFVGGELKNAHSALADIDATVEVLFNMVDKFRINLNIDEMTEQTGLGTAKTQEKKDEFAGGMFKKNEDGKVVCNFGKNKGKKLADIDSGYFKWMKEKGGFPEQVIEVIDKFQSGELS